MSNFRKILYFLGLVLALSSLCEAIYAFFFVSTTMPWWTGRIGAVGWRAGEAILGVNGGHIGYGCIFLLIAVAIAWGLHSDFKKQKRLGADRSDSINGPAKKK